MQLLIYCLIMALIFFGVSFLFFCPLLCYSLLGQSAVCYQHLFPSPLSSGFLLLPHHPSLGLQGTEIVSLSCLLTTAYMDIYTNLFAVLTPLPCLGHPDPTFT